MSRLKVLFCGMAAVLLLGGVVFLVTGKGVDPKSNQENQVTVKLHFDADNTTLWEDYPDQSKGDLAEAEYSGQGGKESLICIGLDNCYSSLIPGFARGYDIYDNNSDPWGPFTPLVIELPDDVNVSTAKLIFRYSGSDPAKVTKKNGGALDEYTPAPGNLRIWNKNGNVLRLKADLLSGGDYITPDNEYPLSAFSIQGGKYIKVYMEGIASEMIGQTDTVKVELSQDGKSGSDSICIGFFRLYMYGAFNLSGV